jgi:hypothetical protein
MAVLTKSTQGVSFSLDVEASFGGGLNDAYDEVRMAEVPDLPTGTLFGVAQPNLHANAFKNSDKPVFLTKFFEDGTYVANIRAAASANGTPVIAMLFESMGCVVSSNLTPFVTTLATYVDAGNWTLTADTYGGVNTSAVCGLLELDSGLYYPVMLADYAFATKTCIPGMEIPSASSATNIWEYATTIIPQARPTPAAKTLAARLSTRGDISEGTGATPYEELSYNYKAVAATGVAELTLGAVGTIPTMSFTLSGVEEGQATEAITSETYIDSQIPLAITQDFNIELGDASAAGDIAQKSFAKKGDATIAFGIKAMPILGEGSASTCPGGIQGYVLQADGRARVTFRGLYQGENAYPDIWTEISTTGNTSQYVGFVQGHRDTTLATPGFGFWMPNCHIPADALPQLHYKDSETIDFTVTYEADIAGYDSGVLNADRGATPWVMCITGNGTAP